MTWLPLLTVLALFTATNGLFNGATLTDKLEHYETFHHTQLKINHRVRRSAYGEGGVPEKDVEFDILNKHFHLRLQPERGLFSKTFAAYKVDKRERKNLFDVDRTNFFKGYLVGAQSRSRVHAYFEDKSLIATITTDEDTYIIEPSWRHLQDSRLQSMLAYRKSDLRSLKDSDPNHPPAGSFCGYVHPDGEDEAAFESESEGDAAFSHRWDVPKKPNDTPKRQKRATNPSHTTCKIMVVGDYHFFQGVGQNDTATAANYMVGQIQKVNDIYRNTNFKGYTGLGFEIESMKLYSTPTAVQSGQTHHNMQQDVWDTKELLKAFSRDSDLSKVCLGHLFTDIPFTDGVLGLGWIASSKAGSAGGICSPSSSGYHYNTAWTTMQNKYGSRVLTQEAELVTAHEFGHNWGSQHDPATSECAPSSFAGGKYLMYTYSVSGYEGNNDQFSSCSRLSIGAVLDAKITSCFRAQSSSFCGNGQVETPYEQCDAAMDASDPCCDLNCEFKQNAVCSDRNSPCCTNCLIEPAGKICRETSNLNTTCEGDSSCDGTSAACTLHSNKPDGTPCYDNGLCQSGQCLSYCATKGLTACICDSVEQSCLTCCNNGSSSACTPYSDSTGQTLNLADGKPCIQGRCQAGVCQKLVIQLTDRIWKVIESININTIAVFMRNNIVLTCIVLSLLAYLPFSLIVAIVDWRKDKNDAEEIKWFSKENDTLYMDKDEGRIRKTFMRKRPNTRTAASRAEGGGRSASSMRTNRIYPDLHE